MRRRWLKTGATLLLGTLVIGIASFFLLFPKIGSWAIRTKVLPKVAERMGRHVTVRSITVTYGRAVLEGVEVTGPADPGKPLVSAERVTVDFAFGPLLHGEIRVGKMVVEKPSVHLIRGADGSDNWSDILDRPPAAAASSGGRSMRPSEVEIVGGTLAAKDELNGIDVNIGDLAGTARPHGKATVEISGITARHRLGPIFAADLVAEADVDDVHGTLSVRVRNGGASLSPKLSLTGIEGTVAAGSEPGRAAIKLSGGYGGAAGTLWRAEGWLDPASRDGDIHLRADRFTLDKIEGVLAGTPVQEPARTSLDVAVDVTARDGDITISGKLNLAGLTVYHAMLADKPVRDLALQGRLEATYHRGTRMLELAELGVSVKGVEARLDGYAALPGSLEGGAVRDKPRVGLHLLVPPVPCQDVLAAFPPELTPHLIGFKLGGEFSTDVRIDIDWANLDALTLDGSVGIRGCKVLAAPPEMSAERLNGEFEHTVEIEEGKEISFLVGPSNPDFVPLFDVSPYLVNSLITTEDGGFRHHHGFIVREFRTALVNNLKEGYFKYGASSITMQIVKNVLLYREKTLSRKLQELFLTWYLETILTKERLLEIYVNVIEFGPGIYGIGPAAAAYFGKRAHDITPIEAAFFSSILPNPKRRYMQYCDGELSKWGDSKVQRILKVSHDRGLLTDEEYAHALEAPLMFDRTDALPPEECKAMTRRMIERARPTTPGARKTTTRTP